MIITGTDYKNGMSKEVKMATENPRHGAQVDFARQVEEQYMVQSRADLMNDSISGISESQTIKRIRGGVHTNN